MTILAHAYGAAQARLSAPLLQLDPCHPLTVHVHLLLRTLSLGGCFSCWPSPMLLLLLLVVVVVLQRITFMKITASLGTWHQLSLPFLCLLLATAMRQGARRMAVLQ